MYLYNVLKSFYQKSDIFSKILWLLFIIVVFISIVESLNSLYQNYSRNSVIGLDYIGLPSYNGSCPSLVANGYAVFKDAEFFQSQTLSKNQNNDAVQYENIRNRMIAVSQLGNFCEDSEAQGRMLYISANIELIGAIHNFRPINLVVFNTVDYYNQAEKLGYNKLHPEQALWLRQRIVRNAHKAGIPIALPTSNPIIPDRNKHFVEILTF